MKVSVKPLVVKFQGKKLTIDLAKELAIDKNTLQSQLLESPSSYYVFLSLKDKAIKLRDDLEREKDAAYSNAWVFYKNSNERWSNDYVSHKANTNPKYQSLCDRYLKAVEKANKYISICKAYEARQDILRSLNANLRKQL